jgi:hypothetical protein
LTEINTRLQIQEAELSTIDNMALRQRLEAGIEKIANDQMDKEKEVNIQLPFISFNMNKAWMFQDLLYFMYFSDSRGD